MKFLLLTLIVIFGLAACSISGFSTQRSENYKNTKPNFIIQEQLGGKIRSEGVIFGPTGKLASRFVADMEGTWKGNNGILRENFTYDNGTTQIREWNITLLENGKLTATAADVIGTAEGEVSGSTMRLNYKLKLTEAAGGHVLNVVDWIYLTEDGTMINKSEMRKFGFKVAELSGTLRPAK